MVGSTRSLGERFGDQVHQHFARTVSLTIVGAILFDLMIKSQGGMFTDSELVEHCEAMIIEDLKIIEETRPIFNFDPMPEVLGELYQQFCGQIWPHLKNNRARLMTASLQRINYQFFEVSFARLEHYDGS